MSPQQDIEIFVRDVPERDLFEWIRARMGDVGTGEPAGDALTYKTAQGPVTVTPNVGDGPFTSVWFNTPYTPWLSDIECARDAVCSLKSVVRCVSGETLHLSTSSSTFLELDSDGERLVSW